MANVTGISQLSLGSLKPCNNLLAMLVTPLAYKLPCFLIVFIPKFFEPLGHEGLRQLDLAKLNYTVLPLSIRA